MKKTICLSLIAAISFAACKKDYSPIKNYSLRQEEDEKRTMEPWEKEVWKTKGYNIKYYDAKGEILHSEDIEYAFTVIFESKRKNAVFIHDNLNDDPQTFHYSYENNNLTFDLISSIIIKAGLNCKIIEITDDNMAWKEEYDNDATYYKTKPDGELKPIKAVKTVIITNFSKVERSSEKSIKGIWKAEGYDRNYYNDEGKLMHSDFYIEPFVVYIDDKYITNVSRIINNDQEVIVPNTHTYTHVNNLITRTSGYAAGNIFADQRQITELTANSMGWREQYVNNWKDKKENKITYTKPAKAVFTIKLAKINDLNDL